MDSERIEQIRERVAKATEGPWEVHHISVRGGNENCTVVSPSGDAELGNWFVSASQWPTDAAFIAHARQDIPDLLAALTAANERAERAEAENERLRSALTEIRDQESCEVNMGNYDDDNVRNLNNAYIAVYDIARRTLEQSHE